MTYLVEIFKIKQKHYKGSVNSLISITTKLLQKICACANRAETNINTIKQIRLIDSDRFVG